MSDIYSLKIINNSDQTGDFCLYQVDKNLEDTNIMSLAWFSKSASAGTDLEYKWKLDYSFFWSKTGKLKPGIIFDSSHATKGSLTKNNVVTFNYENREYQFKNLTSDSHYNGLQYIECDMNIKMHEAAVGVGMHGIATFARNAEPNLGFSFSPRIQYRLAFGSYQQGEVLDLHKISHFTVIDFPMNIYNMTATLNSDNSWTVAPS